MKLKSLLLLAALAACTGGCRKQASAPTTGQQGTGPVAVEFWHTQTGDNAKALDALISKFNAANSGKIQVRGLFQGNYDQLYQKTMAAVAAKRPPEMAVAYESMVAEYMKAGQVRPLDDFLKGPDGYDQQALTDIFPSYLASNRFPEFGNQLLSFPFTKSILVLYYNEKALKEAGFAGPPKTWAEFRQAALKTTRRDASGHVTRYGVGIWPDASTIDGCIFSQGGSLLSGTGAQMRTAFNADPARQAFGLVSDLVKQGAALRTTKQQYTSDFGNGRIAMFLGSSTAREFVTPAVAGKFPWGVSVIPQKNPAKPITVQYGANVVIFKTTPEKERAAWSFMRWLAEPEQTMYWATHSSYMPIRQSVAKHQEMQAFWQKDPQAKQCFEVAPFGATEPNARGWQDVRKALEEAFDKVAAGTLNPADALREAEAKGNKALQEKH